MGLFDRFKKGNTKVAKAVEPKPMDVPIPAGPGPINPPSPQQAPQEIPNPIPKPTESINIGDIPKIGTPSPTESMELPDVSVKEPKTSDPAKQAPEIGPPLPSLEAPPMEKKEPDKPEPSSVPPVEEPKTEEEKPDEAPPLQDEPKDEGSEDESIPFEQFSVDDEESVPDTEEAGVGDKAKLKKEQVLSPIDLDNVKGQVFLSTQKYKSLLSELTMTKNRLTNCKEISQRLNDNKMDAEIQNKKWHEELMDLQKKLVFCDKVLFEG